MKITSVMKIAAEIRVNYRFEALGVMLLAACVLINIQCPQIQHRGLLNAVLC